MDIGFVRGDATRAASHDRSGEAVLMRFDSGRVITIDDGGTHAAVYGSTGSGKTASVGKPMAVNLINAGCPGLILDIKRNMDSFVFGALTAANRAGDYLELGNLASATPVDLLAGMSLQDFHDFCEKATDYVYDGRTQNKDFHMRGPRWARDCLWLLRALSALDDRIGPSLGLVQEMLTDVSAAAELFSLYRDRLLNASDREDMRIAAAIKSDHFHVLCQKKKKKDRMSGRDLTTLEEQTSWGLMGIRHALRNLLDTPGVERLFAPGAPALDRGALFRAGKVILLRMSLDAGPAGSVLARMLMTEAYRAIYGIGLSMDRKIFILADEFQEMADLSGARFSDRGFISQAREFNAIHISLTQSMSALGRGLEDATRVQNFISNQNQLIMFCTNDPMTNNMARTYDYNADLAALEPGQAFVKTYDTSTRRHEHGFETVNQAFAMASAIHPVEPPPQDAPARTLSLTDILDTVSGLAMARNAVRIEERKPTAAPIPEAQGTASLSQRAEGEDVASCRKPGRIFTAQRDAYKNAEAGERGGRGFHGYPAELAARFADMLVIENNDDIRIPAGWRPYVERCLALFRTFGTGEKIGAITTDDCMGLIVRAAGGSYGHARRVCALECLMLGARRLCMRCGRVMPEHFHSPACQDCLDAYGIADMRPTESGPFQPDNS